MARARRDSDVTIIIFLGSTVLVCIIGIIVLSFSSTPTDTQPLVAIASGCVGALATKITQDGRGENGSQKSTDDDALATIVGRAATRSVIAEMMRSMSEPPATPPARPADPET